MTNYMLFSLIHFLEKLIQQCARNKCNKIENWILMLSNATISVFTKLILIVLQFFVLIFILTIFFSLCIPLQKASSISLHSILACFNISCLFFILSLSHTSFCPWLSTSYFQVFQLCVDSSNFTWNLPDDTA